MKVAGVIGGIGARSTADFYHEVFLLCQKKNQIQRPPIFIWSVPGLFETEKNCAIGNNGLEAYRELLIDGAKRLEQGGADFLVMPCNSVHTFFHDVQKAAGIPIFSIIEETVNFLKKKKIKKVGILSTTTTLKRKLYEQAFTEHHIEFIIPSSHEQKELAKIIHKIVQNKAGDKEREYLNAILANMKKAGINDVVLACTDLGLLHPSYEGVTVHDSMKILAVATVREILQN